MPPLLFIICLSGLAYHDMGILSPFTPIICFSGWDYHDLVSCQPWYISLNLTSDIETDRKHLWATSLVKVKSRTAACSKHHTFLNGGSVSYNTSG